MTNARLGSVALILSLVSSTLVCACSDAEELDPPRPRKPRTTLASADFMGSQADVYARRQDYCGSLTTIDTMIASRCAECHQGEGHDGISINDGDPAGNLRTLATLGFDAPGSSLVTTYLSGKHEPLKPPLSACELDAVSKWVELGVARPPVASGPPDDPPVGTVGPDGGVISAGDGGAVSLQDTLFHTKTGPTQRSVEDVLMSCRLCHTTGPAHVDAAGNDFSLAKEFLQLVPVSASSWPANLAAIKKVSHPSTPSKVFRLHIPNTASKADPKADLAQPITVKPGKLSHENAHYPGNTQADLDIVKAWLAAYGK